MSALDDGVLRHVIEAACRNERARLKDLTVLTADNDPYRLDTPAGHRDGRWLADHLERLGYLDRAAIALGDHRTVHLRGAHYALVSTEGLLKPNGEPYRNTADDWEFLQERAAKCARWLGYVPFEAIADARNSPPKLHRRPASTPSAFVSIGVDVTIPMADDIAPQVSIAGFEPRQAFHLVLFGEKTSLEEVLLPIARRFGADLYLPAGEISDTLLFEMARDGAADGRPMVVLIFADCDPAGHQMAVSIGRKLQAFRDLLFPALEFEVYPVALTVEQVREHDLPSTPLKATEQRADAWKRAYGIEQTEIDALAALRPDLLRRVATKAIAPFYDSTLAARATDARVRWHAEAQAALDTHLDADLLDRLREQAAARLSELESEIEAINAALRTATEDLDLDLPLPEMPVARPGGGGGKPLVSTARSWTENSRALLARKRYDGAGGGGS